MSLGTIYCIVHSPELLSLCKSNLGAARLSRDRFALKCFSDSGFLCRSTNYFHVSLGYSTYNHKKYICIYNVKDILSDVKKTLHVIHV